jgi:hypothetical protein
MTEPMSPERLAEIEALYAERDECAGHADSDTCYFGCLDGMGVEVVADLLAEVRRLQRENKLLHLSRGSAPHSLVGMD